MFAISEGTCKSADDYLIHSTLFLPDSFAW